MRKFMQSGVFVAVLAMSLPGFAGGATTTRPANEAAVMHAGVPANMVREPIANRLVRPIPMEALRQAHITLLAERKLVTAKTFRGLGFQSVKEARLSTLGAPSRVFMVPLDGLRKYESNQDPRALLVDTHSVRYPVYVRGDVRSGVMVHEIGAGQWEIESMGRPALSKALVLAAKEGPKTAAGQPGIVVSIPALGLYFSGHVSDEKLELTSAASDTRFDLKAGQTMPAADLFARIAPYARTMVTGPRIVD